MVTIGRRLLVVLLPLLLSVPVALSLPDLATAAPTGCSRTLPTYPVLRPGDRSAAVRTLQCSLNDVGVGPVAVDGFYGPQTKKAVKRITDGFEGQGAPNPYRINNGFWTLLFGSQLPDSNLGLGAHGPAVKVLQRALRAAGATIAVDGNFGSQTEKVVLAYQKEHDIHPANGTVDPNTRFILAMGGVLGGLT